MKVWHELYERHREIRSGADLASELRRRLVKLAEQRHCAPTIRGRFSWTSGARRELSIKPAGESGGQSGEPLLALPTLGDARLTVLVLINRDGHVRQFTAMIEGNTRQGVPWVAAVHLDDCGEARDQDRMGNGACSHAAFHCHVGPTLDDEPKVRVPLPAVSLPDALDWLLSTVIPGWEPAPWDHLATIK
jgi:hypothetical protein